MSGMYSTDDIERAELDYRRAEAIAKIASFAPKLYDLDRLRRYVSQYERPEGGGVDYEAPAEMLGKLRGQQTGRKMPMYHQDALAEMTGELLRRTSQTLSVPKLERLARQVEKEVKGIRREYGNEQRAKSVNGSGPVQVEF